MLLLDFPDRVFNLTFVARVVAYAKDTIMIVEAAGSVIIVDSALKVWDDYKWFVEYNAEETGM